MASEEIWNTSKRIFCEKAVKKDNNNPRIPFNNALMYFSLYGLIFNKTDGRILSNVFLN